MSKLNMLRSEMAKLGLDAVVILDELNQRYLSNFAFTDGLLFITANKAYMVTDFRYYEMALNGADKEFEILMPEARTAYLGNLLSDHSCKRVGFEGLSVSYATYRGYCERYPNIEWVNINDTIEQIRRIKTPEEIEIMQKAQDITDCAFSHILNVINPNMTEIEVAAELEYAMRRAGAAGFAFETIAVSGDASALPHGTPRNVKLKNGFLTMDFGAKYMGYCSDMTRTIVIGKADHDIKKLYNTVLKAQLAAIDFIKAGCDCGEADKIARDIIDVDYKGRFGHSLGHSVGLFIHELPGMSMKAFGKKLEKGNVVTVEPGIYLLGKYGCRIEDMVAVTDDGIYNFTKSTKELIEII